MCYILGEEYTWNQMARTKRKHDHAQSAITLINDIIGWPLRITIMICLIQSMIIGILYKEYRHNKTVFPEIILRVPSRIHDNYNFDVVANNEKYNILLTMIPRHHQPSDKKEDPTTIKPYTGVPLFNPNIVEPTIEDIKQKRKSLFKVIEQLFEVMF